MSFCSQTPELAPTRIFTRLRPLQPRLSIQAIKAAALALKPFGTGYKMPSTATFCAAIAALSINGSSSVWAAPSADPSLIGPLLDVAEPPKPRTEDEADACIAVAILCRTTVWRCPKPRPPRAGPPRPPPPDVEAVATQSAKTAAAEAARRPGAEPVPAVGLQPSDEDPQNWHAPLPLPLQPPLPPPLWRWWSRRRRRWPRRGLRPRPPPPPRRPRGPAPTPCPPPTWPPSTLRPSWAWAARPRAPRPCWPRSTPWPSRWPRPCRRRRAL
mmetsp:Transcript_164163/g.526436  ORF Transcript_164163/g.526436 Transcript_164163/m.526436 type:complete len:270 (-) Transcript_164163:360-1169(-)